MLVCDFAAGAAGQQEQHRTKHLSTSTADVLDQPSDILRPVPERRRGQSRNRRGMFD